MAVNAGILKAIVSFYRFDSETAFKRHRSCILINEIHTVLALKRHLISFLGLKELSSKYGLGDFEVKLYQSAPKTEGKSNNFALTTDEQRNLELPTMLAGTGSESKNMYRHGLVFGIDINLSVKAYSVTGIERLYIPIYKRSELPRS